ncbi:hypothetical protein DEA8626_01273 [Defluviimonas aquaemixtae]|uniref:Uncharacterized protein n=1 Tax=Albidovulum aquaemixtae TaxID=1542388 RepID=A0A2R8B538_9RHOB|nr:hypothetical protein DEA8626_01273 [Defluviimonas aquaemixtae]
MSLLTASHATEVRPRPEGGGDFALALGGGSGANRVAGDPGGRRRVLNAQQGGSGAARFAGEPGLCRAQNPFDPVNGNRKIVLNQRITSDFTREIPSGFTPGGTS